ncbi:hypothetical protein Hanom_Chr01g00089401 [Helianthus anomalus]
MFLMNPMMKLVGILFFINYIIFMYFFNSVSGLCLMKRRKNASRHDSILLNLVSHLKLEFIPH